MLFKILSKCKCFPCGRKLKCLTFSLINANKILGPTYLLWTKQENWSNFNFKFPQLPWIYPNQTPPKWTSMLEEPMNENLHPWSIFFTFTWNRNLSITVTVISASSNSVTSTIFKIFGVHIPEDESYFKIY